MANSRALFSDLKSGKCSFKLCCMKDYEELAATVMTIVDCVVNKTWEKIESSTDVLKGILRPVVVGVEEISWPPRDPEAINEMEKACCFQAKEDKDKPRLAAKLKKVHVLKSLAHSKLPLSTNIISSRLHPITGNEVVKAKHFLETLIKAPEEQWNKFFLRRLTLRKGEVTTDELSAVIKKRIERTLIRTHYKKTRTIPTEKPTEKNRSGFSNGIPTKTCRKSISANSSELRRKILTEYFRRYLVIRSRQKTDKKLTKI
ncbi:unnamed protein product [Brassica napus]|uniref:(rape) hypothetical protein n=1 Tax=Brassica napus TaxID=3708 RepID=A0A816R1H4_BRANA|nr:unnamed protein product [Brassica napus]